MIVRRRMRHPSSSAGFWLRLLALVVLAGVWSGAAMAQARDCTVTVNAMNFGNYDPLETAAAVVVTSTMSLRCTRNNIAAQITLSTGSSGTYASRTMRQGTSVLNYNIYGDAAFVFLWGNGTGGSFRRNATVGTVPVVLTMFGRIPPGQDPLVGPHTDTIIVTMTF